MRPLSIRYAPAARVGVGVGQGEEDPCQKLAALHPAHESSPAAKLDHICAAVHLDSRDARSFRPPSRKFQAAAPGLKYSSPAGTVGGSSIAPLAPSLPQLPAMQGAQVLTHLASKHTNSCRLGCEHTASLPELPTEHRPLRYSRNHQARPPWAPHLPARTRGSSQGRRCAARRTRCLPSACGPPVGGIMGGEDRQTRWLFSKGWPAV